MERSSARLAVGRVDRIHERPADAGGVRAERGRDVLGQLRAEAAEVFEHAAARPVRIGAVLEDHVDEREPVERVAAHDLLARHRKHLGRDRIRDLVLDDLRRLARPLGVDDDLHVGQVRDGVQRNVAHARRRRPARAQASSSRTMNLFFSEKSMMPLSMDRKRSERRTSERGSWASDVRTTSGRTARNSLSRPHQRRHHQSSSWLPADVVVMVSSRLDQSLHGRIKSQLVNAQFFIVSNASLSFPFAYVAAPHDPMLHAPTLNALTLVADAPSASSPPRSSRASPWTVSTSFISHFGHTPGLSETTSASSAMGQV